MQDPKILRGKVEAYRLKSAQNYNKRYKVVTLPVLQPEDQVYIRDQGCYGEKLPEHTSDNVATHEGGMLLHN